MTVFSWVTVAGTALVALIWCAWLTFETARTTGEIPEFFFALVLFLLIVCAITGVCWLTGLQVVKLL